jgi:zinc-ribbon domain
MSESEIEIARRCTFCGVSVRERAMFCPQCGNPVGSHESAPTSISLSDTIVDTEPPPPAAPDPAATQPLSSVVPPMVEPTPAVKSQVVHKPAEPHGVLSRVEHIRKVSSVMIDQAAYDPSLRFLLVAAAFFILFLVLLIMSKVIG